IVGLASYGKTTYESGYNSGIGSNGLTSARHDLLNKKYSIAYPETFEPSLPGDVVYIGGKSLTDTVEITDGNAAFQTSIGSLILSPTRTYAPVIKKLLQHNFNAIKGLIHCSGGGQTKCMKYMPEGVGVIKDNLFEPPEIFRLIQKASVADDREMYQVFNMGCRFEIYTDIERAGEIIETAGRFNLPAQIIGRVEQSSEKELIIKTGEVEIRY
ncbi:MAG TPA: AIR synthase-related protein, partial [Flavisolibacter sp.]|nr:AIR synthase-related protein [Flavisolibacter sp.]